MIWFIIATLSSILTIFLWVKDECNIIRKNKYKILYPIFFVILSALSISQYFQINEMTKIENEASKISKDWPNIDRIAYLTKGERLGIIWAGQIFLEKHKLHFLDTYIDFQNFKKERLGDLTSKTDFIENQKEYHDLEDVCGATITIIRNLANK